MACSRSYLFKGHSSSLDKHVLSRITPYTLHSTLSKSFTSSIPDSSHPKPHLREQILNVPNLLTLSRILLSPFIGYHVYAHHYDLAAGLLLVASATDALDGYLARSWNQKTWLGSTLDPLADKVLVTSLTVSMTMNGLLPLSLGALILTRDIGLIFGTAFYRYQSLPPPKTLSRYFDASLPTIEVRPPLISKVNTFLQLSLMGATLLCAYMGMLDHPALILLQICVAITTIWSTAHYVFATSSTIRIRQP